MSSADSRLADTLIVFSDGACRGNPGPSGAGWVVKAADGSALAHGNLFLGHRTNNEAEYMAAIAGVQAAIDLGAHQVILRADSQLMVRQLSGVYRVRHPRVAPLYQALVALGRQLPTPLVAQHILRHLNTEADAQANLAIDQASDGAVAQATGRR